MMRLIVLIFTSAVVYHCSWKVNGACQRMIPLEGRKTGYIVNEGYPSFYYNDTHCAWLVTTSPGTVIRFFLTVSWLELCSGCSCDYIEIYDGPTYNDSHLMIRACKASYKDTFTTTSNQGLVYFNTDSGLKNTNDMQLAQGFHIYYEESTQIMTTPGPSRLEIVDGTILGTLSTQSFLLGEQMSSWREDLKDSSSPVYEKAKDFFEGELKTIYNQANIPFSSISVRQFKKQETGEDLVNDTMAEYLASVSLVALPGMSTTALEIQTDNSLDSAIIVLHQSGMFYEMFENGPLHDIIELVVKIPTEEVIDKYEQIMWVAVGSVLGLFALILISVTFCVMMKHNRHCRQLTAPIY